MTTWEELITPPTPIGRLVHCRMRWLGLSRAQLAALCGYRNRAKGTRRIEQICHGDLWRMEPLLAKLPTVLNLQQDVVMAAIEETRKQVEQRRPRRHYPLVWISHPDVDYYIYKHLRFIWLDEDLPVEEMHRQIRAEIARRQSTYPRMGPVDGYVIHFDRKRAE